MWGGGEWTSGSVGLEEEDEEEEEEVILLQPSQGDMRLLAKAQQALPLTTTPLRQGRRPLLVLDLNGLLVDRVFIRNPKERQQFIRQVTAQKLGRPTRSGDFLIFLRPGSKDFVHFAVQRFDVAIWSSARKRNIAPLVKLLFPASLRGQLRAIYGQENCHRIDNYKDRQKPLFVKELRNLWQECGSAETTLLIDDSPEKAQFNPPFTSIHPPAWAHTQKGDSELCQGGKLREFLNAVACASLADEAFTIPGFLKANPFDEFTPGSETK